ncbi:transglycosylase SLT domain-containing protein [Nitrospira sp. KM1]|uniref:transglycosylase SLT domain-containing protein n=1 Tax=Nitrospira sp. KM1 TaxID=1936990 RepID=UPI001565C617|nr:transglycosylase SLT domain-containing protein [Nitrospira sp. KM1]
MAPRLLSRAERSRRQQRGRRITGRSIWRFVRLWLQALRTSLASAPVSIRWLSAGLIILFVWLTVNWTYHAINKPTEMLFPLDRALDKSPSQTWREYGSLFRKHSTKTIPPELLAALAQVEGDGNPVARTYWRWRPAWNPFTVYQPASSAVGMYQITDAAFQEGKRYCVHNHVVVEDGPWHDMQSCWFNSLYTRVLPSHAIELTSALLDRGVAGALRHRRLAPATPPHKHDLATVIHLCGPSIGNSYAARGFRLGPNQQCGSHDVAKYLQRVNDMKRQFAKLAAAS